MQCKWGVEMMMRYEYGQRKCWEGQVDGFYGSSGFVRGSKEFEAKRNGVRCPQLELVPLSPL